LIRERLRGRLEAWLLRVWFRDPRASATDRVLAALAAPVAWPLSLLVAAVARRRRSRIRRQRPGDGTVPVVVVGNLVAGGAGKTPLAAAIAQGLAAAGLRPALLSGGYRASGTAPALVTPASDVAAVGDEALALARDTGLPVASGRDRAAALALLLANHPDRDVVVSDDGLQHTGLPRRIELAVVDERGLGNGRCLPAGPLREPADRLALVDAIVDTSGRARAPATAGTPDVAAAVTGGAGARRFRSNVTPRRWRRLDGTADWTLEGFVAAVRGRRLAAVAGMARPERFFDTLRGLGLAAQSHRLPDHGRIDPAWLAALPADWILMTGKDAARCGGFAPELLARCAWLEVAAEPEPALIEWLVAALRPGAAR
jgi:tetraacyldisaccharide 4'-kinase